MRDRSTFLLRAGLLLFLSFRTDVGVAQERISSGGDAGPVADCGGSLAALTADLADPRAPLLRMAEISGRVPLRAMPGGRASDQAAGAVDRFSIRVYPARLHAVENTAYATARLDGALWAGRGLSTLLQAGILLRIGPVSAGLVPEWTWQQNRDFATLPNQRDDLSELADPFNAPGLDRPQRFGRDAFARAEAGQSFVRVDLFGIAAGLSRENVRFGPARHNPLLLGHGAGGFPHVFAGTSGEIRTPLGGLQLESVWGHVEESAHFDERGDNDTRLLSGLTASWRPPGAEGLTVGGARLFMATLIDGGGSLVGQLLEPYTGVKRNDSGTGAENQMLSLFLRWVLPRSGFEVYGEWARDDHWWSLADLLKEPDHSQAYTIGFAWLDAVRPGPASADVPVDAHWGLALEHTHLQFSETAASGRPAVTFYTHGGIVQGMTHRGQLLGAPIGPGSNATTAELWRVAARGASVLDVRHVHFDIDAAALGRRGLDSDERDTEWSFGLRHDHRLGDFWIGGGVRFSHRPNRSYLESLEVAEPQAINWGLTVDLVWLPNLAWPPGSRRAD